MKICLGLFLLLSLTAAGQTPAPTTIREMKEALEKSPNPLLYTKEVLRKKFRLDTVTVTQTRHFGGLADSLAYHGKEKRVYGPYGPRNGRFLVQILSKAPNEFYHISQIFIDTAVFRYRFADSLGNVIMKKLRNGSATFEEMARTYGLGTNASGDLGWIARGAMYPVIEHEILSHKKGEVFKLWSRAGLNIIRKDDEPRQDTGFALMMQVFL
ncbi:MAG TPA: peptidylprolyl isomerase [Puia sp.]|nr:peptidylprolyl isomerase [Puia sp.]